MRVRVSIAVEVDEAAWEAEYGVAPGALLRADVLAYIQSLIDDSVAPMEVVAS